VHATSNAVGLSAYALSWWQRRRGGGGRAAGLAGAVALGVGGWLGGHPSQRAAACSRQAPDRARSGEATAGPDPDAPSEDPEAPEPDDDSMSHGVIITTESEERGPRLRLGLRSARQPPSAPSTGGLSKARGSFEQDNPRAERVRAAFGVLARALAADPVVVEVAGSARAGPGRGGGDGGRGPP
jgi:hypothetical protein